MTVLEQLGAHVARGRRGLSESARQVLRLHLADTVGAWIAGSATPEGRALIEFSWQQAGPGVLDRVATNCALARLSEIDDIHLASATTPGALVVPAALTIAASVRRKDGALAEAIAVGYDAIVRLGEALGGPSILTRGIWPTYFAAPFGVAAVASRLLGLTDEQAAHALGTALILASPSVGHPSGAMMARWLAIGNAVRNGVAAVFSAKAGFSADLRLFEGEFFSGAYKLSPDAAALVEALEERSVVAEVSFKPWCAARQTMAATQALKEIIESGVLPSEMTELVVNVPPPTLRMIDHGVVPGDRASHLTSVAYQMALAAFTPDAALDVRQAPNGVSEEIRTFMSKVAVKADEELLGHYPKSWPARLVVTAPSGKREKLVLHVPGDPERPFDEGQVAEKFRRLVAPASGERATSALLSRSLAVLEGSPTALLAEIDRACAE